MQAACQFDDPFLPKEQGKAILKAKGAKPVEYVTAILDLVRERKYKSLPSGQILFKHVFQILANNKR
jgi:hypothetical protein